jgi:hypothetical protein
MTSDIAHRTLWCLIEGDSTTFQVIAPVNANIDRLKELVHEKCKNTLSNVDGKDLVLWKVCALGSIEIDRYELMCLGSSGIR